MIVQKRYAFLVTILAMVINCNAQILSLQEQTGSNGRDEANAMYSNSTGVVIGYQFGGSNVIFNGGTMVKSPNACKEMAVIKYDHSNNVLWSSKIGFQSSPPLCSSKKGVIDAITMNAAGEVFVAGRFSFKDVSFSGTQTLSKPCDNDMDIFITKYSSTGAVLWAEKYETFDGSDRIVDMAVTSSGKLIISGIFWSSELNWHAQIINRTDRTASFIGSIDASNGQANWLEAFNGGVSTKKIAIDGSDNIVWLGNIYGYNNDIVGNTIHSQGKLDMVLGIFDESGNYISHKNFIGSGNDIGTSLIVDGTNIWLSGRTNGPTISSTSLANGQSDEGKYISFLIQLNSSLNITSSIQIEGDGHEGPKVENLCKLDNGNIAITGVSDGSTVQLSSLSHALNGNTFVAYMTLSGSILSANSFDLKNTGTLFTGTTPSGAIIMGHASQAAVNGSTYNTSGGSDSCIMSWSHHTGAVGSDVFLIKAD